MDSLARNVLSLLYQQSQGMSEYALLKTLQEMKEPHFAPIDPGDQLALFKQHFRLFHILYRLQQHLGSHQAAQLTISPFIIQLLPYTVSQSSEMHLHDPLRDYYLDAKHLHNACEKEIHEMLAEFWKLMDNRDGEQKALRTLELQGPCDLATVRRQFKRLSLRHHPDRGGDKEMFVEIQSAANTLETLYKFRK